MRELGARAPFRLDTSRMEASARCGITGLSVELLAPWMTDEAIAPRLILAEYMALDLCTHPCGPPLILGFGECRSVVLGD